MPHRLFSTIITFTLFISAGLPIGATDLVQAPEESVLYELSNLRAEKGITGDLIVFDYKRTREGKGSAQLVGRTDDGTVNINTIFSRIDAITSKHFAPAWTAA